MPRFRLEYLRILLLVFLIFTVGCTGPETSQEKPENLSQKAQHEQVQSEQNQNSTGREKVEKQSKTMEQGGQQPTEKQQNLTVSPEKETVPGLVPATVIYVVDGDTIHVNLAGGRKEKVRFIGVDTPESTREIEPYGKKASAYTKSRLNGRKIWLELDAQERDRYGRLLAYIWLENPAGTGENEVRAKMFNAELLLEGYAQVMTIPPNVKYADYFVEYQREAREANKGLWSLAIESEDYYVASKKSNKFHRPECKWGRKIAPYNLIKFGSKDEAFDAGYEPCRVCNP